MGLEPHNLVLVAGIGCSGKIISYFRSYGFHGIHGRTLPLALGIHLANPQVKLLVAGGDGDGYSIGLSHTLHAIRRNMDVTYLVMNNQTYGLTKGQCSPTSDEGFVTGSTPFGAIEQPLNPLALALAAGVTFLARAFSGQPQQMVELIEAGLSHKGFALIDIFSPCVTYNKVNTYDWFRQTIYDLGESGHDSTDIHQAMRVALDQTRLGVGLVYQKSGQRSYEEAALAEDVVPTRQPLNGMDYRPILEEFV